jgi:hypothetical protein
MSHRTSARLALVSAINVASLVGIGTVAVQGIGYGALGFPGLLVAIAVAGRDPLGLLEHTSVRRGARVLLAGNVALSAGVWTLISLFFGILALNYADPRGLVPLAFSVGLARLTFVALSVAVGRSEPCVLIDSMAVFAPAS